MKIPRVKIPHLSFDFLLGSILVLLLATPFIEGKDNPLLPVLFALVLFSGAYATSFQRRQLAASAILGVPWLVLSVMKTFAGAPIQQIYPRIFFAAFVFYTAIVILVHIVRQGEVTRNLISGGIAVYFLFAVGWAAIFAILDTITPGSIVFFPGEPLEAFSSYLYFSITTITTAGYGDVVPISPFARMLAAMEAAVGLLFIGVFIASLIGKFRK